MRVSPTLSALLCLCLGCSTRAVSYDPPDAFFDDAGPPPRRDGGQPPGEDARVIVAEEPPPPASGGTLLVTSDGAYAVAASPHHDRVFLVGLASRTVVRTVTLGDGEEPGRLVEDGNRRVHVVLRGVGAVVTFDVGSGTIVERRDVCAAPRGIAWEEATDLVHVACATGELVSLPAAGGPAVREVFLETDLRDVVVAWGGLVVSRFRSAEALVVDSEGMITRRVWPPMLSAPMAMPPVEFQPGVAYRLFAAGSRVFMVHQRAVSTPFDPDVEGYGAGGMCSPGVVHSTVTEIHEDGASTVSPPLMMITLPLDGAVSSDGRLSVVSGANAPLQRIATMPVSLLGELTPDDCLFDEGPASETGSELAAVAFAPDGTLLVQTRNPDGVEFVGTFSSHVTFGMPSVHDSGYEMFHQATRSGLACASCHPEAHEDGHIWEFAGVGRRRTQTLLGGLLTTAPFHWSGDQPDLTAIMRATFERRMGGGTVTPDGIDAVGGWLDALPALRGVAGDPTGVAHGRKLFEDSTVRCSECHAGSQLTDSRTLDVGTGARFQVPSLLGVAQRAPWLHDGCATTLVATFDGTCSTPGLHGDVSGLDAASLADLVAYVQSL